MFHSKFHACAKVAYIQELIFAQKFFSNFFLKKLCDVENTVFSEFSNRL